MTMEDETPGQKESNMLIGKSGGQLLIAPERMKQLGQRRNDAQLWICLVVKVKSDAVKNKSYLGTWNVRSMNQGELDTVRQKMARVNIDILGISELNGQEWVNLIWVTIIPTTVGKNLIEKME